MCRIRGSIKGFGISLWSSVKNMLALEAPSGCFLRLLTSPSQEVISKYRFKYQIHNHNCNANALTNYCTYWRTTRLYFLPQKWKPKYPNHKSIGWHLQPVFTASSNKLKSTSNEHLNTHQCEAHDIHCSQGGSLRSFGFTFEELSCRPSLYTVQPLALTQWMDVFFFHIWQGEWYKIIPPPHIDSINSADIIYCQTTFPYLS